jgi:hypothetical protein
MKPLKSTVRIAAGGTLNSTEYKKLRKAFDTALRAYRELNPEYATKGGEIVALPPHFSPERITALAEAKNRLVDIDRRRSAGALTLSLSLRPEGTYDVFLNLQTTITRSSTKDSVFARYYGPDGSQVASRLLWSGDGKDKLQKIDTVRVRVSSSADLQNVITFIPEAYGPTKGEVTISTTIQVMHWQKVGSPVKIPPSRLEPAKRPAGG